MNPNPSNPILCGTDFSGNARHAANVAAAFAKRLNTPLILVHASTHKANESIHEGSLTPSFEEKLLALAPEKSNAPEVEVTQSWETAVAICAPASRRRCSAPSRWLC